MLIAFGLILMVIATILMFVHFSTKKKLGIMAATETRTVEFLQSLAQKMRAKMGEGAFKNYLAVVKGQIVCENPLIAELSKTPCVHYKMNVTRETEETYYERDDKGIEQRKTRKNTDTVASNERSVSFFIEDATGKMRVDPTGAEMITEQVLSRYETSQSDWQPSIQIDGLGWRMNWGSSSDKRVLGYRFTEEAIPVDRELYILGAVTEQSSGELRIVNPSQKGKFIISLKSEEELLKQKQSSAKWTLIFAIICDVIGLILLVMGVLK